MTLVYFLSGLTVGIILVLLLVMIKFSRGFNITVNMQQQEKETPAEKIKSLDDLQESLDTANSELQSRNLYLDGVIQSLNEVMNGGTLDEDQTS